MTQLNKTFRCYLLHDIWDLRRSWHLKNSLSRFDSILLLKVSKISMIDIFPYRCRCFTRNLIFVWSCVLCFFSILDLDVDKVVDSTKSVLTIFLNIKTNSNKISKIFRYIVTRAEKKMFHRISEWSQSRWMSVSERESIRNIIIMKMKTR